MKWLLLFFLFASPKLSFGEASLGIGIVRIQFDNKTVIDFYKSPNDKSHYKRLEFFDDPEINSFNIRDLQKEMEWLKPETLWLDYSQFNFRCNSKNSDWFEVIVNKENGSSLWIKKSELTRFETWEEYLKEMFAVERRTKEKQQIKTAPSDQSKSFKYENKKDCFKVTGMKGDWIEISTTSYCDQNEKPGKLGWIRWKRNQQLLINYYHTS